MVSSNHYLEIYVNGNALDLMDDVSLRINDQIFSPTESISKTATYSYSFQVPSTPNNDEILHFANVLESSNKFNVRYNADVYADGKLIFKGSMVVAKYDQKDRKYTINLVNVKQNTISDVFGEESLYDSLKWEVPFSGVVSMNEANSGNTKYFFPMVSQGVFQKTPYYQDEVAKDYTSKYLIDKYNNWWYNSFFPSLNVLETMRNVLVNKGFKVGGNAFEDPILTNVYASTNLANDQIPTYNLGNQKFGHLKLTTTWNTSNKEPYKQALKFPYFYIQSYPYRSTSTVTVGGGNLTREVKYNLDTIDFWNLFEQTSTTASHDSYLWDKGESLVIIPQSGWYKISLSSTTQLLDSATTMSCVHYVDYADGNGIQMKELNVEKNIGETAPIEIQVIRNHDFETNTIELIKGKRNIRYMNGDPTMSIFNYQRGQLGWREGGYTNRNLWYTDFPHQDQLRTLDPPTKTEALIASALEQSVQTPHTVIGRNGQANLVTNGGRAGHSGSSEGNFPYKIGEWEVESYTTRNTHVFDQGVSQSFICGLSTMGSGQPSVMRNGRSWSRLVATTNDVYANVEGFSRTERKVNANGSTSYKHKFSDYCKNEWLNAPSNYCTVNGSSMSGRVDLMLWLERNDRLEVVAVQRDYMGYQKYDTSGVTTFEITAMSDKNRVFLDKEGFSYTSTTEFPQNLQLNEFVNKETKTSDWIDNIAKAFNLDIVQNGDNIDINVNDSTSSKARDVVELDDRVSNHSNTDAEVTFERIEWPRQIGVQWTINTDEYGFEQTVPLEYINDEDWEKYGDSGCSIIKLSDDLYNTDDKITTVPFSFCWYKDFQYEPLDSGDTSNGDTRYISLPIINLSQYQIDKTFYEDDMAVDGFSLTQRFWFRPSQSSGSLWTRENPTRECLDMWIPVGEYLGINLSYKYQEPSLLTNYFKIKPLLGSEYCYVETYLTPLEYARLKGGSLVRFNNDLFYVCSIEGYDPKGRNKTKLKLLRKTDIN